MNYNAKNVLLVAAIALVAVAVANRVPMVGNIVNNTK